MKLFVINTPSAVYAAYGNTICNRIAVANEKERSHALNECKISVFNYAITFGKVELFIYELPNIKSDIGVFAFLHNHKI